MIPDFRVALGVGATKCQLPTLLCGRAEDGCAPVAGLTKIHTASKSEQPLAPGLRGQGWAGTWPSEWTPAWGSAWRPRGLPAMSPGPGSLHGSWLGGGGGGGGWGLGPEEGQWRDGLGSAGLTLPFSFLCSHQNGRGNLEIQGLQRWPAQWPAVAWEQGALPRRARQQPAPVLPGAALHVLCTFSDWGGARDRARRWGGAV